MIVSSLVFLALASTTQEPPAWVIRGMLATETSSEIINGKVIRRDKRNDRDSLGCLQMREIAWRDVCDKLPGRKREELETDHALAIQATILYLKRYYKTETGWDGAIQSYNAGPNKKSPIYLSKVKKAGIK